jgi:CBS domain containing-hemolysin-like protein
LKRILKKLFGKNAEEEDLPLGESEREKREMIQGIVELSETTVREIMVPRIDVVSFSADTDLKELLDEVVDCGHSRVPVYKDTIDNVVGILYAKDLLSYLVKEPAELSLAEIIRPPYFVPESKKINSLLREFKKRRVHISIAVDEYGGTSGIVCLEDIIEEIVGEIQDEFDNETEEILEIGEKVYLCDARAGIEDLNERLHLDLPAVDYDTLGGFVLNLFGKIPVKFEKVAHNNVDFVIQEMDGHKIIKMKLIVNNPDSESKEVAAETG